jgi:hypothetical protein
LQRVAAMMDAQHIDASPVLYVGTFDKHINAEEKPHEYPTDLK